MMEQQVCVYADLDGASVFAGRLWTRLRRGRESAGFEYEKAWLSRSDRFAWSPP